MLDRELRRDVYAYARRRVLSSDDSVEAIAEDAYDVFASERVDGDKLRTLAGRAAREMHEAHLVEQSAWPTPTDCDRLDAAFAALEAEGVVARQDFTCCQTCGCGEIQGEMAEAAATGRHVVGYTFFHSQDTTHAFDGEGLYLSYGAAEGGAEAVAAIGARVAAALEGAGLRVNWGGDVKRRIGVALTWRRRRAA